MNLWTWHLWEYRTTSSYWNPAPSCFHLLQSYLCFWKEISTSITSADLMVISKNFTMLFQSTSHLYTKALLWNHMIRVQFSCDQCAFGLHQMMKYQTYPKIFNPWTSQTNPLPCQFAYHGSAQSQSEQHSAGHPPKDPQAESWLTFFTWHNVLFKDFLMINQFCIEWATSFTWEGASVYASVVACCILWDCRKEDCNEFKENCASRPDVMTLWRAIVWGWWAYDNTVPISAG